ncbi:response regulator [Cohnella sp. CFH 77786]|uniref:response regulator transcription factor n=1 Tax=Cohnella sp. CFH 77786 TaxID=2662265 RepID=UPI001C60E2EC|nr:response regulator [Cohnella sp. CFH 77786]MBW5445733.1 response regulator [Cohnella sp. CFH 77786]
MIRMVIADDETMTRMGLSQLAWEKEGFAVAGVAENGLEALELVRSAEPDLLLTDIRMPGLDGLALMEAAHREKPGLKVIFITAYHHMEYALQAIKLGALGFVLKPTDPDEILETCRNAKKRIEEERERKRAEEGLRGQLKEISLALQNKLVPEPEEAAPHGVVQDILADMAEQYASEITIEQMARKYHFHPDYLSRMFKRETGDHFSNTLARIRMQKAVELLADRRVKVYEISEKVGIRDTRYFGQLFKKRYGVTPGDFRKRLFAGQPETESEAEEA